MNRDKAAKPLGRACLVIALIGVLAGCAATGDPFTRVSPDPAQSVIYVYRPYTYAASALHPAVTCGDETARIAPGAYHAFVVPKGKTDCTVHTETIDQVEVPAEPRVHYIKEEFGWGRLIGHPHLNPIDTDQAQAEIQKCCVLEHPAPPTP
jgi:hypothetical protein